jgi:transposase
MRRLPVEGMVPQFVQGHAFLVVMGLMLLHYPQWETREMGFPVPDFSSSYGTGR